MSKIKDYIIDHHENPIKFIEIKTFPRVAVFQDFSSEEVVTFSLNYEQLKTRIKNLTSKNVNTNEERLALAGFELEGTTCYDVAMKVIDRWLKENSTSKS